MSDYLRMTKRQKIWLIIILLISVLLALVMPKKHLFSGIALGVTVSLYNLWILQRKAQAQGEAAERDGSRKGTGVISRFAAAALGTLLTIQLEWSIVGYIIGLMTVYPVIMIDFIWFNRK